MSGVEFSKGEKQIVVSFGEIQGDKDNEQRKEFQRAFVGVLILHCMNVLDELNQLANNQEESRKLSLKINQTESFYQLGQLTLVEDRVRNQLRVEGSEKAVADLFNTFYCKKLQGSAYSDVSIRLHQEEKFDNQIKVVFDNYAKHSAVSNSNALLINPTYPKCPLNIPARKPVSLLAEFVIKANENDASKLFEEIEDKIEDIFLILRERIVDLSEEQKKIVLKIQSNQCEAKTTRLFSFIYNIRSGLLNKQYSLKHEKISGISLMKNALYQSNYDYNTSLKIVFKDPNTRRIFKSGVFRTSKTETAFNRVRRYAGDINNTQDHTGEYTGLRLFNPSELANKQQDKSLGDSCHTTVPQSAKPAQPPMLSYF